MRERLHPMVFECGVVGMQDKAATGTIQRFTRRHEDDGGREARQT